MKSFSSPKPAWRRLAAGTPLALPPLARAGDRWNFPKPVTPIALGTRHSWLTLVSFKVWEGAEGLEGPLPSPPHHAWQTQPEVR